MLSMGSVLIACVNPLSSLRRYNVLGIVTLPIFQMRKLRPREVWSIAQCYTWQRGRHLGFEHPQSLWGFGTCSSVPWFRELVAGIMLGTLGPGRGSYNSWESLPGKERMREAKGAGESQDFSRVTEGSTDFRASALCPRRTAATFLLGTQVCSRR